MHGRFFPTFTPYPASSKYILLILFGTAFLIGFLHWNHYRSEVFNWDWFFRKYLDRLLFLGFIAWNPKGVRLLVLGVLLSLLYLDIRAAFFISGMSVLPWHYLYSDVYSRFKLDSLYAFIAELGLITFLLYFTFKWKIKKRETDLLDG